MSPDTLQAGNVHDVYAYGVIAPSRLVELQGDFPSEAGYGEIARIHPSFGGEAAGGAYVLARLGVTTKLSGNRLGTDPDSGRVIELLTRAGVDCSAVSTDSADPVTEIVFSSRAERTVFGSYTRMLDTEDWSRPARDEVTSSRIVCLDPFFGDASVEVATWCQEASIPYVTIDTTPDSDLTRGADALIVSEEFASRSFRSNDPYEVLAGYTRSCDGLVVLTRGSEPLLYARGGGPVVEFAPFSVEARDTAGAGDSFRAGVIYGMLRGYADPRLIETASALSAMVCRQVPGVLNSPSEQELERFLEQNR